MKDPDDAALSALLRQNRGSIPGPSDSFRTRVLRAYEGQVPARGAWHRLLFRMVPVPVAVGAVIAVTLFLIGFAAGTKIRFARKAGEFTERVRRGEPSATNGMANGGPAPSLGGLQVVAELRPRIIGGDRENK